MCSPRPSQVRAAKTSVWVGDAFSDAGIALVAFSSRDGAGIRIELVTPTGARLWIASVQSGVVHALRASIDGDSFLVHVDDRLLIFSVDA